MESNRKHIDDLFKNELGSYTEAPPPAVWEALEKRLDKKKGRRLFAWLWLALIGFAIVSLSVLFAGKRITSKTVIANTKGNTIHGNNKPAGNIVNNKKKNNIHAKLEAVTYNNKKDEKLIAGSRSVKKTVHRTHVQHEIVSEPGLEGLKDGQDEAVSVIRGTVKNEEPSRKITFNKEANTSGEGIMTNEITSKGHIRIEQAVIKHHDTENEQKEGGNDTPLLVMNTNDPADNIAIVRKHGIVVQTLPGEVVQPQEAEGSSREQRQKAVTEGRGRRQGQKVVVAKRSDRDSKNIHGKKYVQNINALAKNVRKNKVKNALTAAIHKPVKLSKKGHSVNHTDHILVASKTKTSAKSFTKQIHKKNALAVARKVTDRSKHEKSISTKNSYAAVNKKKVRTASKRLVADNGVKKAVQKTTNKKEKLASTRNKKIATKKVAKNNNSHTALPMQPVQTMQTTLQSATPQKHANNFSSSVPPPTAIQIAQAGKSTAQPKLANAFSRNISAPSITPKATIVNNNTVLASKNEDAKLPGTFKESVLKTAAADNSAGAVSDTLADKKRHRFEAGIKAGYEGGFNSDAAKKLVVSPYIQYKINSRLSVMSQPAVMSSQVSGRALSGSQSFYSINPGGSYKKTDSIVVLGIPNGGGVDTFIRRDYAYSQTYDSIAKTYRYGGSYIEFQVPLLLKYSLTKTLSVYGGATMTYSKLVNITENTYTSTPITKTGSGYTIAPSYQAAPAPPPISSVITYSGTPISNYTGPLYPVPQSGLFRLGYMLGFSYEYKKRFLLDVSLEQSNVSTNMQGGYDVNKPLSSAYLRFTVGYILIK